MAASEAEDPDELLNQLQAAAQEQKRIADRQEAILIRLRQELQKGQGNKE